MIPPVALPLPPAAPPGDRTHAAAGQAFEALVIQRMLATARIVPGGSALADVGLGAVAAALAEARPFGLAALLDPPKDTPA